MKKMMFKIVKSDCMNVKRDSDRNSHQGADMYIQYYFYDAFLILREECISDDNGEANC